MKKLLIFLCLYLPFFAGCASAPLIISPIVTGVIMWNDGEAHKYYNEESLVLYRATKTSLKELGHPILKDERKNGNYYISAGENDKFSIVIRQVKPRITEIKIRVNFLGDKPYAELVYSQIDSNTNSIEFDNQGRPTKNKQKKLFGQ